MIIIYDFDGTLTPYVLPQYPILKKCGYTNEELMLRIEKEMSNEVDFYAAYYRSYKNVLLESGLKISLDNMCFGAENVQFNNGVLEYFENLQNSKTGLKHYIITSGIKDYIEKTPISKFVDGIFGVTFKQENGIIKDIDVLLSAEKKVDVIKKVQKENDYTKQIIYLGDGLTDRFAFEYVHSIGGKNIFVIANEEAKEVYQELNAKGIIDRCFNADYGINAPISQYIKSKMLSD